MSKYKLALYFICGAAIVAVIIGLALTREQVPGIGESGMKKFSSVEELAAYISTGEQAQGVGYYREMAGGAVLSTAVPPSKAAEGSLTDGFTGGGSGSASDYSATNVQVSGVDEADFVKNDGKYIYLIAGRELVIIDAYPAKEAEIISRISLSGEPQEIFVKGNRAVIFCNSNEEVLIKPKSSVAPVPYRRQVTHACVYDLTDRKVPELYRDVAVSGSYYDSRLIGDDVYLITSQHTGWYGDEPIVPVVEEDSGQTVTPDIYYYDVPGYSYQYYTIASLSLSGRESPKVQSFLAGYSTTLFVSPQNVYLAYRKDNPVVRWEKSAGFENAAVQETAPPVEETLIHRFAIGGGDIAYKATGDVPGHLLNQFSMDEYKGYLRVATTVEGWSSSRSYMYNNVYVLDAHLDRVGELEFIAPDERIYATRFMGDRLYMVTFKRIDPFFVIDLSDPARPGILGKLKIPGYSDYLHPYDGNHIIGVGKETEENQWGGVSTSGLKLALFDVSDVNNPALVDKVEIGEAGTDSEALRDHKAFLFDWEKDLLVIPVREVKRVDIYDSPYKSYTQEIRQVAYVFSVSPAKGFTTRGTVIHQSNEEPYYYWDSPDTVRRSLYIDDVLYTISTHEVIMTSLKDLENRINTVELPSYVYGGAMPYPIK